MPESELVPFEFVQFQMGMPVTLNVFASNLSDAKESCKAAFDKIRTLVMVFSDYEPISETSRVNRLPIGHSMEVSPAFVEVFQSSKDIFQRTEGAFNPTAGELIKLWRSARKDHKLPAADAVANALSQSGFEAFELSQLDGTWMITRRSSATLDFGSIAKGYIGQQAIRTLAERGISIAKFSAGGDIVCGDPPPRKKGWVFEKPSGESLTIANAAVAVSGDSEQFVEIKGKRYSHVIDPRSGRAIVDSKSVVVIAQHGMQSDALATIGCVVTKAQFEQILERFPGSQGWQITSQKSKQAE